MSSRSGRGSLDQHQQALGGAFYQAGAEEHREHLQLKLEEHRARAAIADATGIRDSELLAELAGLGIRVDSLAALTLIPLIDVAWCDGELDERERAAVLDAAVATGIERDSVSYRLLELWMIEAPPPDLTDLWKAFVRAVCSQIEPKQAERMEANLLGRAREVARVAGDALDQRPHVSQREEECLGELQTAFDD